MATWKRHPSALALSIQQKFWLEILKIPRAKYNVKVHSGFTDPFQATACLFIVPAARGIQKSGTGHNNFVKWKGLFGRTDRNEWTGQSEPLSKVVPNIPVGRNRNGSFHLISDQKLRIFGLNGKRPRKIGCNKFMMYEMWHQRSCVTVEVERSHWPRDLTPTRTYDLS